MNNVIEVIKSRRTTKAFRRDEQIKDEELELILERGLSDNLRQKAR